MITDPARIRKTDPGNPTVCTVFSFYSIFKPDNLSVVEQSCCLGERGCVECKNNLSELMLQYLEPIQQRRRELEDNPNRVTEVLEEGREKAVQVARTTMEEVRSIVGL